MWSELVIISGMVTLCCFPSCPGCGAEPQETWLHPLPADLLQPHYTRIPHGDFTLGELEGNNMEKNNLLFLRQQALFPRNEELLLILPKVINFSLAAFSFHLAWPCSLHEGKSVRCIPRKMASRPHLF